MKILSNNEAQCVSGGIFAAIPVVYATPVIWHGIRPGGMPLPIPVPTPPVSPLWSVTM